MGTGGGKARLPEPASWPSTTLEVAIKWAWLLLVVLTFLTFPSGAEAQSCSATFTCASGGAVTCTGNVSCNASNGSVTCVTVQSCGAGCTETTTVTRTCSGGGENDPFHQEP